MTELTGFLGLDSNLVTVESLRDPDVRADIPSLESALDAFKVGDLGLFIIRTQMFQRAHAPVAFLSDLLVGLLERDQDYTVVAHEPGVSAKENYTAIREAMGEGTIEFGMLKTVLLQVDGQRVLVSRVGDGFLSTEEKKAIAKCFGWSRSQWKGAVINPAFDTTLFLGLIPGTVKTILEPHLTYSLQGIVHLRDPDSPRQTAFLVSPLDSILCPTETFEDELERCGNTHYSDFRPIENADLKGFGWVRNVDTPNDIFGLELLYALTEDL